MSFSNFGLRLVVTATKWEEVTHGSHDRVDKMDC